VAALTKGTEILTHKMTLLTAEVRTLRTANEALSKRRRAKRTRVQQGGVLTIEEGSDILARKNAMKEVKANTRVLRGGLNTDLPSTKRCDFCKKPGHNTRTCQEAL